MDLGCVITRVTSAEEFTMKSRPLRSTDNHTTCPFVGILFSSYWTYTNNGELIYALSEWCFPRLINIRSGLTLRFWLFILQKLIQSIYICNSTMQWTTVNLENTYVQMQAFEKLLRNESSNGFAGKRWGSCDAWGPRLSCKFAPWGSVTSNKVSVFFDYTEMAGILWCSDWDIYVVLTECSITNDWLLSFYELSENVV